ncbi:helix-turn-helix domain-containing protein [Listeria sp. ILCC792]|uniref:helix-turn-helix domain-containing protein n=1 Tax=Listeria sp. ILCC792 TaxID=1918331 RepID=UPI000B58DDAE|nr:helix-turn-helix transcriptional regulator [Listeria sp. ILCC792]
MTTFDRVKKLAESQKISIVELEEKLGFGRNSLYSWKKKTPNGDSLQKVADFFNVSTDYLLGRTDIKLPLEADNATSESREYSTIQRYARGLDKKDQTKLIKIMEATFDDLKNGNIKDDEEDDDL